jgi:hypothetical protein
MPCGWYAGAVMFVLALHGCVERSYAARCPPGWDPIIVRVVPGAIGLGTASTVAVTLVGGCTPRDLAGTCAAGANASSSCSCLLQWSCDSHAVAAGGVLNVTSATGGGGGAVVLCAFPAVTGLPGGCSTNAAPALDVFITLDGAEFTPPGVELAVRAPCVDRSPFGCASCGANASCAWCPAVSGGGGTCVEGASAPRWCSSHPSCTIPVAALIPPNSILVPLLAGCGVGACVYACISCSKRSNAWMSSHRASRAQAQMRINSEDYDSSVYVAAR